MGKVIPLIAFGLTIFVGGLYWAVWNGSRTYLDNFVIVDEYYELMYFGWRMIPAVMLIVGLMCLIAAGVMARSQKEVVEY